jgi:hypothetical protein
MTGLALPEGYCPSNLHLAESVRHRFVDSDMFDICKRLAHISRSLFIVQLYDPEVDKGNYVIMEHGYDGGAYMVLKTDVLDARVLEKAEYLLRVPFDHRFAEAERLERKAEEDIRIEALNETAELVAGPMRRQLWHDGFIEHRETSYPTKGVAQPRKHR